MLHPLLTALALVIQDPCLATGSAECIALQQQIKAERNCYDDNMTNRCDEAEQARVRSLRGVASAEDEAGSGVEMYRAFFVDGYGFDRPVITFERRRGASPRVLVNGSNEVWMASPISPELWRQVRLRAQYVDRDLAAVPTSGDDLTICLHSWVVTAEAVDPNAEGGRAVVRRKTQNACEGGLATEFAFALARDAIGVLYPCNELDSDGYRNDVERLATCLWLEGDKLAAVEFLNARSARATRIPDGQSSEAWKEWLGFSNTRSLDWDGERVNETPARPGIPRISVADFLAAKSHETGAMSLFPEELRGDNSTQVSTSGSLWVADRSDPSGEGALSASYHQTWRLNPLSEEWVLESWVVGPFTAKEP